MKKRKPDSPERRAKKRAHYYRIRQDPRVVAQHRAKNRADYQRFIERRRQVARDISRKLWLQCIHAYGALCACCGETELAFLSIDHKRNDGNAHRRALGSATATYRDIVKRKFPPEFQVLCYNCNHAKHLVGYCPHEQRRDEEIERMVV
jgi:hypothetical protein